MHPIRWILCGIVTLSVPAAASGQQVVREWILPPGEYMLGQVTAVRPIAIDLGAAEGLAPGQIIDLHRPKSGFARVGTLVLDRVSAGRSEGTLRAGTAELGDLAVFRKGEPPTRAAEREPVPTGVVTRNEQATLSLTIPAGVVAGAGRDYPVRNPSGSTARIRLGPIRGHEAEATAFGPVELGAQVLFPGRTLCVAGGTEIDPLVGRTLCLRFRNRPSSTKTTYYQALIVQVDRSRKGPVPAVVAEVEAGQGPVRWRIEPGDLQQWLDLDALPPGDRTAALAHWNRERQDELARAPHREWEDVFRAYLRKPPTSGRSGDWLQGVGRALGGFR